MKEDILEILTRQYNELTPEQLNSCRELFKNEQEFEILKNMLIQTKEEVIREEITPSEKMKESLMGTFDQKWKKESAPWWKWNISTSNGQKPFYARPLPVAIAIGCLLVMVLPFIPVTEKDNSQIAKVEESAVQRTEQLVDSVMRERNGGGSPEINVPAREVLAATKEQDLESGTIQVAADTVSLELYEEKKNAFVASREGKTKDADEHAQSLALAKEQEVSADLSAKQFMNYSGAVSGIEREVEETHAFTLSQNEADVLWGMLEPAY